MPVLSASTGKPLHRVFFGDNDTLDDASPGKHKPSGHATGWRVDSSGKPVEPAAAASVAAVSLHPVLPPPSTPPHALDDAAQAWLRANGMARAVDAAEERARWAKGEEADVAAHASSEAWRVCDLALAAQPPSDLFDESLLEHAAAANTARRKTSEAACDSLRKLGVCDEHLGLPPERLLPLLHEMAFARIVGASALARRKCPPAASFGPQHAWPVGDAPSTPPPPELPLLLLLVSRGDEDVGWLSQLCARSPPIEPRPRRVPRSERRAFALPSAR